VSKGHRKLFDALEQLFHIRFEERDLGDDAGIDAWVLNGLDVKSAGMFTRSGLTCYTTINNVERIPCGESKIIEFSLNDAIPFVLRGRKINTEEAAECMALPPQLRCFSIIASKAGFPLWAIQESMHCRHHYVSMSIPELNDDEPLFRYFHGEQFLRLLPFFLFLRSLADDKGWEPPPLQACFMFDDPNLHWPTYGFMKFAEMMRHAGTYKYHSSIATIPLDAWFFHKPTVSLFKEHRDRMSLLIHGNDHTSHELSQPCSEKERNQILLQALLRIAAFERRSGLEVSKVMAPPHGACSEDFLRGMSNVGFEAACISRGSLRRDNRQAKWLTTIGIRSSDIVEGLTIFPRFALSGNCHNSILLAALLHQPIIPVGHHEDISEGLQMLGDLSTFVNSLGDVRWANMSGISRSHFSRMTDGAILRIRMHTRRVEVSVPEGTDRIRVERSRSEEVEPESFAWRILEDKAEWKPCRSDQLITVPPGKKTEIVRPPPSTSMDENTVRKFQLWPVMRRQVTEARDRVAPALRRFSI